MSNTFSANRLLHLAARGLTFAAPLASVQTSTATIESAQAKLIRAPYAVTTPGPDLFGDKVNFYHGGLPA